MCAVKDMPFLHIKKQYLALGMLVFITLLFLNSRPTLHCQEAPLERIVTTEGPPPENIYKENAIIYGITPTYARLTQKADLTRLSQTLMLVKNFHWIVIEDSTTKTSLVARLLKESGLQYTHMNVKTDKADKAKSKAMASGVEQRNLALAWLRKHLKSIENKTGVVYFMDDDNTYSIKIFDEMRKIRKVGVWPVGIVGGMKVEMPIVVNKKVTEFNALWKPYRPFPIDMAGFAINATLFLREPQAKFTRNVQSGFQESEILSFFTKKEELEPLADNCTKVYVWHTRTQKPALLKGAKLAKDNDIEV